MRMVARLPSHIQHHRESLVEPLLKRFGACAYVYGLGRLTLPLRVAQHPDNEVPKRGQYSEKTALGWVLRVQNCSL